MCFEVIQFILSFLIGYAGTGATPTMPAIQIIPTQPSVTFDPQIDEDSGIEIFFHLVLGPIMSRTKNDMLKKFQMMKPHTLIGCGTEDTF